MLQLKKAYQVGRDVLGKSELLRDVGYKGGVSKDLEVADWIRTG